jgi:HJR/Mrr/RecB family endonuclease
MIIHLLPPDLVIQWFNYSALDHLEAIPWVASPRPSEVNSLVATFIRLIVLATLLLVAVVFLRVLIELRIEQRRKRRLITASSICSLSPAEFEAYVGLLFEKAGYRVKRMGRSGDRGIDLVLHRNRRASVAQCKRYEDNVGPSTIRELIGAMTNAGANHGFLVTTSAFTTGAVREAREAPYRIDLVDGETLVRWARRHGLPGELADAERSGANTQLRSRQ